MKNLRVRAAIIDRHLAGESAIEIADDFDLTEDAVDILIASVPEALRRGFSRNEYYYEVDGSMVYWPQGAGFLSAEYLRAIVNFLDAENNREDPK
jgi:hypothetical protein